ncbi:CHAT domain-containing protein [Dendronalium sp. ChiSLP03b]|uniref:CHAT domain-containing protein n=1 Tax=Dendronalium sp. ChiSLP03b TaxID=3075381 RepID=UPI002AD33494|nr:CHAT domain-containing protein [Dendronalium sp. ChiSLP03b]MDZ8207026.1 CHAT domain-containing protein [Dendronalium sp. ChiSLP03b]
MSSNPAVKRILILAANPKPTNRLRLDEEVRDIQEGLLRSQGRDKFELRYYLAVRPRDIRSAILDFRPNIIHFSGHGQETKGLCFEDETGHLQFVTGEALAGLFENFAKQVECVLLNACYSQVQANAIVQHINYVIGMNDKIEDKAALEFAVGFYDALTAYNPQYDEGTPVEFAFRIARNAIMLAGVSGESVPVLIPKSNPTKLDAKISIESVTTESAKKASMQYSGKTKIIICQRLTQDWQNLADYFDIKLHERAGLKQGREAHGVWEWLEQRGRLGELETALSDIGRDDLTELLKKNN